MEDDHPEPYAVLSDNNTVLTFYYDNQKEARGGMSVGPFSSSDKSGWDNARESITSVVFDESLADCMTLTSTAFWFDECSHLTTISGISNLKTDNVTNMIAMFEGCSNLTDLDLSGFNTDNVTDMREMFADCSSLTSLDLSSFNTQNVMDMSRMFIHCSSLRTIYVGEGWSTDNVTSSDYIFTGCTSLVGGQGTAFDANHVDATYAHIDGGPSNPGYFTDFELADSVNITIEVEGRGRVLIAGIEVEDETKTVKVPAHISRRLDFVPDEGYRLAKLLVGEYDHTWMANNGSYMIRTVVSDTTVYVVFMEDIETFMVDGIRYGVTNLTAGEVKVIAGDYTGSLSIPSQVSHGGREWTVTGLDRSALRGCPWLVTVSVPQTVTSVGQDLFKKDRRLAAIRWESPVKMDRPVMGDFTNPNMLLYMKDAACAPEGAQNIIVDGVAERIVLTDVTGDGNCDYYCPEAFTARHISYQHAYTQATHIDVRGGWETLALPFNVQEVRHERQGSIQPFAALKEEDIEAGAKPFWLYTYTDADTYEHTADIKAYTPYIIAMPNDPAYEEEYILCGFVTFSSENIEVPRTPDSDDLVVGRQKYFIPNLSRQPNGQNQFCINSYQTYAAKPEGSIFVRNLRDVRPFESYFRYPAGAAVKEWFGVLEEITDGIREMRNEKLGIKTGSGAVYDLSGRRIAAQQLSRGIYIQSGKKVIKR